MEYVLYFLQFDTPVHFGCGEDGGKLEQSSLAYRADTLFSALCCELAAYGNQDGLQHLHELAANGAILLSDLFPYEYQEEPELYVPKPVLSIDKKAVPEMTYESFKKQSAQQKKMKKLQYLRVSELETFLQALQEGRTPAVKSVSYGQGQTVVRVNCLDQVPRPYYVHALTFAEQTGLYGIMAFQDEREADYLLSLVEQLGLSGIGGKRSSGYGKFHFREEPLFLDAEGIYHDDGILYQMLANDHAKQYMNLSVLLPQKEEIPLIKEGQYTLCRRSGFLSPDGGGACKKHDVYMIQAGSCFTQRLQGQIVDVAAMNTHPVWRYGRGLYVGLTL